ncbi:MAG: UbiA prenyltransferase family protein [Defluviitaleaceae bacterium]|nr:UbiA prenyltransferase family protein [Defluviitaleaceae bacterium]
MTKLRNYIKLMRPKHYIKNLLLFAPLIYSQSLPHGVVWFSAAAFAAFCLAASAIYVVNDIFDSEKDALHPVNKTRPIASGRVGKKQAVFFAALLLAACFALIFALGMWFVALFAGIYVVLNLVYSLKLKHYPIVDCFCIAAGFVLRIYAGGAAISVEISEWMFLTVAAAALFMAFGKRRGEMMQVGGHGRQSLAKYNLGALNAMMFVCMGLAMVFYALWAISGVPLMIYTVPLIIFIGCRYLLAISHKKSHGDPVSVILGDKVLVASIALFGVLSFVFLY